MNRPWLDAYDRYVPKKIEIPEAAIGQYMESWCLPRFRTLPAFRLHDYAVSYTEVFSAARGLASFLLRNGLAPGQQTALVIPNLFHFPVAYFGVLLAGNTAVLLNPLYTVPELESCLKDSESTGVITIDLLQDRVMPAAEGAGIKTVVVGRTIDLLPLQVQWLARVFRRTNLVQIHKGAVPFAAAIRADRVHLPPAPSPEDPAVLIYTGGTTGTSKAATLTHRNLLANVLQCDAWFPHITPQQKTVASAIPFFHSFGLTVCLNFSMYRGLVSHLHPRFMLQAFAESLVKDPPVILPGSPTLFQALLSVADKRYDLKGIVFAISGAAPLNPSTLLQFEEKTGCIFVEGFGLTEASPVTHITPLFGKRKLGSVGVPIPGTDAKIVDMDDGVTELPPGREGELVIKGPQVMKGYWKKPEETTKALRDGWLYTGDIARMDPDGFFYIVDRKKDLIIVNGLNVYPIEIEQQAMKFPGVKDAAAVGVPDKITGEAVILFVIPDPENPPDRVKLRTFLVESLAPHKVPRSIEFVDEFPRTFLGKVLKRELRKRASR